MTTHVPIVPDHVVDSLRLRPLTERTWRPIPGRLIGFWRDSAAEVSPLPWPADHLDPTMPLGERERVAALLDAAPMVARYMGYALDRLGTKQVGSGTRAQAGWIFPEGLSHYVRMYGLVLPPEMIEALSS